MSAPVTGNVPPDRGELLRGWDRGVEGCGVEGTGVDTPGTVLDVVGAGCSAIVWFGSHATATPLIWGHTGTNTPPNR
jgi:hypothetical protein